MCYLLGNLLLLVGMCDTLHVREGKVEGSRIIPLTAEGHSIWVFFSVGTKATMSKGLERGLKWSGAGPCVSV